MPYANHADRIAYERSSHGRERHDAANRSWRERNKEKVRAHSAVQRALKSGKLVRPLDCETCGDVYVGKIEAHHDDYSKPLEVKWLCDSCHKQRHIELRIEARPFQDMRWKINDELGLAHDDKKPDYSDVPF